MYHRQYSTTFELELAWDKNRSIDSIGRCCHPENLTLPNISIIGTGYAGDYSGEIFHVVRSSDEHFPTNSWQVTSSHPHTVEYLKPTISIINGTLSSGYAQMMSTRGNDLITLVGENFGRKGLTNPVVAVEYGPPGKFFFCSQICTVTVAHTEMVCNTSNGVGAGHVWRVYLGHHFDSLRRVPGPASVATSSYGPPIIDHTGISSDIVDTMHNSSDLFVVDNVAIPNLDTRGGQKVRIRGQNFGVPSYRFAGCFGSPRVDELANVGASYGRVRDSSKSAWHQKIYTAGSCKVTEDHVEITCNTVDGTGKGHHWTLMVGGVSSTIFDYI